MAHPSPGSRAAGREKLPVVGAALAVASGVAGGLFAGQPGALAAGGFGLLAAAIQAVAHRLTRQPQALTLPQFLKRWGVGMGLRLLGVVLVGVVIWLDPPALPPLPAALGYIGVLIPLLFLEARRI